MKTIDSFKGEYFFLSNFYPCKVEFEGIVYPSSEHAYMASKTTDLELRNKISNLPSAKEAKKFGRALELREDWDFIKIKYMYEIVKVKFTQNEDLKKLLLGTEDALLVEGNWWGDRFWGVCKGEGLNCLGRILMVVRYELKKVS